jgi:hypothetical protein
MLMIIVYIAAAIIAFNILLILTIIYNWIRTPEEMRGIRKLNPHMSYPQITNRR